MAKVNTATCKMLKWAAGKDSAKKAFYTVKTVTASDVEHYSQGSPIVEDEDMEDPDDERTSSGNWDIAW